MLDIAKTLSASTSVRALTGSSRPGAVPPLVPLGATAAFQPACGHVGGATSGHVDADVIDLAGRVKRLARRDHDLWDRRAAIDDAVDAEMPTLPNRPENPVCGTLQEVEADGMRITTMTVPTTPDPTYAAALAAYDAAVAERTRLEAEMEARLGYPRLEKLSKRTFARLTRWTERLALMEPQTQAGLKAKAEVQGVLAETSNAGDWVTEFAGSVGRDALRIIGTEADARYQEDQARDGGLFSLIKRYGPARQRYSDAPGTEVDAADKALAEVEDAIEVLAPRTIAGLIAKAEWVLERDPRQETTIPESFLRQVAAFGGSTSAQVHPDAELLALAPAWEASAARCDATTATLDDATDRLQACTIPVPEALFWTEQDHRRAKPYGTDHVATGRRWFGEASSIEALRQGYPKELPEERRREIMEAYERWQGEKWAAGETSGYVAACEADQDAGAENRALRQKILAMPARTVDGVLLKARVARWCFMDDEDEIARHLASERTDSAAAGETMAFSILLDLARMVGAEPAATSTAGPLSNLRPVPLPTGLSARHLGADGAGDVREWYRSWLYAELRLLNLELDGTAETLAVRQDNPGADFHFPADMDWRDVPKPSTRAAAVLGLVGITPADRDDGLPLPEASAA